MPGATEVWRSSLEMTFSRSLARTFCVTLFAICFANAPGRFARKQTHRPRVATDASVVHLESPEELYRHVGFMHSLGVPMTLAERPRRAGRQHWVSQASRPPGRKEIDKNPLVGMLGFWNTHSHTPICSCSRFDTLCTCMNRWSRFRCHDNG